MIRGKRVILRVVTEGDLALLHTLQSDLSLRGEFLLSKLTPEPLFQKEFRETGFLARDKGLLLIADLQGHLIGNIGYFSVNYMDGFELWYQLFEIASRGTGLMTEALKMAVQYLFGVHKINRLQLAIAPSNEASSRVATKCGFTLEGKLRGSVFHRGSSQDLLLYSLLRAELDACQSAP
jgi:ribosomal-protein-alanine N-acetyltransferase